MLKTADDMIRTVQTGIECVDVAAAKEIYDANPDAVIIDVREAHSADQSKLSESINISRGLLEMKVQQACPQASTVILTHCGGGKYNSQLKKAYASGARCALILEGEDEMAEIKAKILDDAGATTNLATSSVSEWLTEFFNKPK